MNPTHRNNTFIDTNSKKIFNFLYVNLLQRRDGQFVQDSDKSSPQRADLRLLTISSTYFQITEHN